MLFLDRIPLNVNYDNKFQLLEDILEVYFSTTQGAQIMKRLSDCHSLYNTIVI